ncbi:MAG: S4 domain-containing protein, partial [Henriciella sp.]
MTATAEPSDNGTRLDRFLSEKIETLSRSRAKALIKQGAVNIGDRVIEDPKLAVRPGDTFELDM